MDNIRVAGAGKISGGTYESITSAGSCKITEDIVAKEIKISGAGRAAGNVECKYLDISGAFVILGSARCDIVEASGNLKVWGKMDAANINVSGSFKMLDELNVDKLYVRSTNSKFTNIYGDEIIIKTEVLPLSFTKNEAIEIEATTVDVINLRAKKISAHDVTIGKRCEIDLVEYTGTLTIHPRANVKESKKII